METKTESIDQVAARIVEQNVNCCLSSLVSTLADGHVVGRNSMPGDIDLYRLSEQAYELAAPIDDYEDAAIQAGWTQRPGGRWWREPLEDERESERHEMFLGSGPFTYAESLTDACELDGIESYQRDVFEHWSVSQWLGEKLRDKGEKVDSDFAGMVVWARTTTGQLISMDSVIQDIAKSIA